MKKSVEVGRNDYISLLVEKFAENFEKMEKESALFKSEIQNVVSTMVAMLQEADAKDNIVERRGRKKITQLLGCYEDKKVCSWFDKIRRRLKCIIDNMTELMVCFFCALFNIVPSGDGYGKATYFHKMIGKHLKEKIPLINMFQKAVKWFREWKDSKENKKYEERKHRLWDRLYQKIKDELLRLEPQLAVC